MRRRMELPRGLVKPHERRQHQRREYIGTLWLQCAGEPTWFEVCGQDVSAGGFAFVSAVKLSVGERLAVSVPEVPYETLAATVRRIVSSDIGWLVGVEFDESLPYAVEQSLVG
jgi:PilZ domain-containing protein